jgi:broad specificity phosphatase PhoE
MTLLYLIRHARTALNDNGRMQGWADQPLDDYGRAQAQALAARLATERFDAIYASPLLRSRETAEIIAAPHQLAVSLDDRLRERNIGEWTGLTFEEARRHSPTAGPDWRLAGAPGGETQIALALRVAAMLDQVITGHPAATVAVVSHGGALSAYLAHLLGLPFERPVSFAFPNTGLARISVRPHPAGGFDVRVLTLGDDRHLTNSR